MKEFLKSFFSWKVAANVLAMILLTIGLIVSAYFLLGVYTHHGEQIEVPNIVKKDYTVAKEELEKLGLEIIVTDTVYNKNLPADIIMEQTPAAGAIVKSGRYIFVIINAGASPKKPIPDIIDNCSAREAVAQLKALGFKRIDIQYIAGEKEWVYGLKANGKYITNGTVVSVEVRLTLQVGDGTRDLGDSVTYTETPYYYEAEESPDHEDEEIELHEYEYQEVDRNEINNLLDLEDLTR